MRKLAAGILIVPWALLKPSQRKINFPRLQSSQDIVDTGMLKVCYTQSCITMVLEKESHHLKIIRTDSLTFQLLKLGSRNYTVCTNILWPVSFPIKTDCECTMVNFSVWNIYLQQLILWTFSICTLLKHQYSGYKDDEETRILTLVQSQTWIQQQKGEFAATTLHFSSVVGSSHWN